MWATLLHLAAMLTGGLGGGLLRLLPEGLNLIKQHMANGHELDMMDKQLQIQKEIGAERLQEVRVTSAAQTEQAVVKGSVDTTTHTGSPWMDAFNASVRPVITYWMFGLYAMAKTLMIWQAWDISLNELVTVAWTHRDSATLAGMLSFWFLGRVIDKQRNGG